MHPTPCIQNMLRNGILFEDDHPLVLADETRRSKGRIGEFRDLNPSNPVPKKPKWIGKNMRMMKALKAGYYSLVFVFVFVFVLPVLSC